jgi:hypothetical protein
MIRFTGTSLQLQLPTRNLSLLSESRTDLYYYFGLSILFFCIHESNDFYNFPKTVNSLCYPVGCHGNLVFNNLLPGNDSFAVIRCNGNVITEPLLRNGRLALAPLFRLSAVTS